MMEAKAPAPAPRRAQTITRKVKTPFGSMYIHIDFDPTNSFVTGGNISSPMKEPESTVATCIQELSTALDDALREVGEAMQIIRNALSTSTSTSAPEEKA